MSSNEPSGIGLTTTGCRRPCDFMEPASSSMLASSNDRLGCLGFGRSLLTSSRRSAGRGGIGGTAGTGTLTIEEGMRLLSPLPSAFLFMLHELLRQVEVRLGASGSNVVQEDRFAVAGRFTEADVPGHDRFV